MPPSYPPAWPRAHKPSGGGIDERTFAIYDELSRGGIGLIITGFTSVAGNDRYFGGMMRLHDDALVVQYARLIDLIHQQGVPVVAQLALGAFYREDGRQTEPTGMTVEEIELVERQFIEAAVRAQAAGFDGVQIHVAHYFFLSRFNMDGFCLFAPDRRSSLQLCLAYEAAKLVDPAQARPFLMRLRPATVQECRPTTKHDEILRVVRLCGIDQGAFVTRLENGDALAALKEDARYAHSLGVVGLPAFSVACGDRMAIIRGVATYELLMRAIDSVTAD